MFMQGTGPLQMTTPASIEQKALFYRGRPVGVSLRNGQGVSGILCSVQGGQIYLIQYLYATQFATFHYGYNEIADILPYPSC
ncbi:hypothetical protein [Paenibacillus harenae]|uniref:hypothetical protein n=1 Tax=Paenibacillus harenae TaxID=306543 RepID=UPI0027D81776|nr:hypothetical protein [Paenibacillus harenae]